MQKFLKFILVFCLVNGIINFNIPLVENLLIKTVYSANVNFDIESQFGRAKMFSDGLAIVKKDEKWSYIDKTGKLIIDYQFDWANSFSGGLLI